MRTTTLFVPLIVVVAAASLAGCSSSASSPAATSTKTSSASAPKCVDGKLTVTGRAHDKINVKTACDAITVAANGAIISLPTAKSVDITGSKNTVTVESSDAITASGSNNIVFYGAAVKPVVTDTGTANAIAQR